MRSGRDGIRATSQSWGEELEGKLKIVSERVLTNGISRNIRN